MPCLCRMKKYIIHGLLWLYIISTGLFVVSLEPGYLDFDNLPDTNFSCVGKVIGGYYADLETNCQMFHVCTIGQLDEPMDIRFLCLNGTVFDQETRVCERIDEVDCSKSEKFYSLNLELYGNTAPPILEENAETEPPAVEKAVSSTTTTTTTTTTPRPSSTTSPRTHYFTSSSRPVTPSPYHKGPSSHQFSIEQPPSYSPEEINISLNPGAPPNIRTNPFQFPQHNPYSENGKKTLTTPSSVFESDEEEHSEEDNSRFSSSTTESVKNNFNQHVQPSHNSFKYNFNYHDTRPRDFSPPRGNNYQYHHNYGNFRPSVSSNNPFQYRSSTHRNEYLPITRKNFEINHPSSTSRSFFLQPIKSPSHQYFTRTEKPQGNQLPVPVLPTLSPIVFSSPAPFSLSRHIETKRYTDEHELPPRIIISASASVSDASGRTLNYSLGTIGAAQILAQPPASYDDYKEADVVLDPFYHDVPKIKENAKRTKRDTSGNEVSPGQSGLSAVVTTSSESKRSKRTPQNSHPSEIIRSEEEAVEVLKFLFDWYKTHEKTTKPPIKIPVSPELISTINEQFSQRPYLSQDYENEESQSLDKSTTSEQNQKDFQASAYPNKKASYGDNLLHQATKDLSSNINNENVFIDSENYSPSIEAHLDYTTTQNIYHNTPKPPHQKLETLHTTKNINRGRPYRGRHRFTFPYVTTNSPKPREKNYGDYKRRPQPSSQKDYEDFYDFKNRYNDYDSREANTEETRFQKDHSENFENLSSKTKYISNTIPSTTFLYSSEVTDVHPESKTIRYLQLENKNLESSTQNNIESTINREKKIEENTLNYQSTTETFTFTKNKDNLELDSISSEMTKEETTTGAYGTINVYDYVDDNYEPSVYAQNNDERNNSTKNKSVEVKDIIHEETNINIHPEDQSYSQQKETTTFSAIKETSSNINNSTNTRNQYELNHLNNSVTIDNNTSFSDVLNSLRDFQKVEQNIYNYQQNLTDIKPFKQELFTTKIEEVTTIASRDVADHNFTHVYNKNTEKTIDATEEKQNANSIVNEGYASSTSYNYETTENYINTYEPHLYTSKPFKNRLDYDTTKVSQYETAISTEKSPDFETTSGIEEITNGENSISTTQQYEAGDDESTVVFSTPKNEKLRNENSDLTTQKSPEEYQEEKTTHRIRYRERNRELARPDSYRKRVENMPVPNSSGFDGQERNSRRQQNKPFYHQDETTTDLSTITSTEAYDKVTATEKSIPPLSTTENIINIEKFILNNIYAKTSYENFPITDSVNGFYVTKNQETKHEKEDTKRFDSSYTTEVNTIAITNRSASKITDESLTLSSKYTDSIRLNPNFTSDTESLTETPPSSTENTYESNPTSSFEEESSTNIPKVTTTTYYSTTNPSEIDEDISTTPNTFTTLDIKKIEAFTGSIAAIQSSTHGDKKVKEIKNTDSTTEIYTTVDNEFRTENQESRQNLELATEMGDENSNLLATTTEFSTTIENLYTEYEGNSGDFRKTDEQKKITEKPTTGYETNTDATSKEHSIKNENVTEKGIQTTTPTIEETTVEMRRTRISIITQINTEESTTQTRENISAERGKYSADNEIVNEQNKGSDTNRDARKFNNRKYQPKSKSGRNRFSSRHRFSSVNVTPRSSNRRTYSKTSEITEKTSTSGEILSHNRAISSPKGELMTEIFLSKNVKPTLESAKEKKLSTTPMLYKVQLRKEKVNKQFVFNCFGKPLNQFYSDPRDCRLFHYCTNGYSKNQLLDMKFVCDLGTHFDDEKLVCTREIPKRCL